MDETAHRRQPALLVPVEFSARSLRAAVAAVRWAHAAAQRVVLLHVIDVNLNWPDTGPVNVARLERELWAEAKAKMDKLVRSLAPEMCRWNRSSAKDCPGRRFCESGQARESR